MKSFAAKSLAAALVLFSLAPPAWAAPGTHPVERVTRERLIGAWRLLRIEYTVDQAATADPFYQAGSTGLLVYDSSGWMSVQITAPHRRAWDVPAVRDPSPEDASSREIKASAIDSYYAYTGTWEIDSSTATLTHHVVDALLPAESGQSYAQQVRLEGGRLYFTNHSIDHGRPAMRIKIWVRATPH